MIDPNPNNSYKTKKKFTGSFTEVNPRIGMDLHRSYLLASDRDPV